MSKVFWSLLIVSMVAGVALATPTVEWQLVRAGATVSADGISPLPGTYSTYDLMVTTGTNFAAGNMFIEANEAGGIFKHNLGDFTPVNPGFFGIYPDLEYDTYVTAPDVDGAWPYPVGTISPGDLAAALGVPNPGISMDNQNVYVGWAVSSGDDLTGPGTWAVARVTTRDGDLGHWDMMIWETDDGQTPNKTAVISGNLPVFDIPEPTTMLVLGLGIVAAVIRRRR